MGIDKTTQDLLKTYVGKNINVDYFNYDGDNSEQEGVLLDVFENVLKLKIVETFKYNGTLEKHNRFMFIPFEGEGMLRINSLYDEKMDLIYEN